MITSEKSSLLISFVDEKIQGIAETGKKTLHCPPLLSGHIEFCNPVAGIADVVFVGKTGITHPSPAKAALAEALQQEMWSCRGHNNAFRNSPVLLSGTPPVHEEVLSPFSVQGRYCSSLSARTYQVFESLFFQIVKPFLHP